jgi:hypothetical protein
MPSSGPTLNFRIYEAEVQNERLFLVFFPNPDNTAVTDQANILGYECSIYTKETLQNGGYLNSAFCMTDSTGTPNNCSNPTVVGGKTRITLDFDYVPELNSTLPDGDLEVKVEGSDVPRWFSGVVGAYYTEVSGSTRQIDLHTNLSGVSFSVHVKRRQGSIDTSDQNATRIAAMQEAIVGSAAQVAAGQATHSSLQAAHDALSSNGRILLLVSTITENFSWTKQGIMIEGKGYGSVLNGNLTCSATKNYARAFKVVGNINLTSSDDGFFQLWMGASSTFTTGGAGNDERIIAE